MNDPKFYYIIPFSPYKDWEVSGSGEIEFNDIPPSSLTLNELEDLLKIAKLHKQAWEMYKATDQKDPSVYWTIMKLWS